jgi:ABC-type Fe3+-hydroxamate transport system substrate-binding protein
MKLLDVEFNEVNGGSFSFVAAPENSTRMPSPSVATAIGNELSIGLERTHIFEGFAARVNENKKKLREFASEIRSSGKRLACLGASTKGNVLLQHFGINGDMVSAIGEVNEDKFGKFTPGSLIPIMDENLVLAEKPDYLLVLPWHFRESFTKQKKFKGFSLVFPLPQFEVVDV